MDFALRCNSTKCRVQLSTCAVVTTCSHIFCVTCSDTSGLSNAPGRDRACPACGASLPNPDDAVAANLDPSEDYKTSVLSGLSPSLIMECAGRGLAFYTYQATQEILFQEYLAKCLTEKYDTLSSQMDEVIHDANNEISKLRAKLSAIAIDNERLLTSQNEIKNAYNEKTRAHARIQKQYDNLKRQSLQIDMQTAAASEAEETTKVANSRRDEDPNRPYSLQKESRPFDKIGISRSCRRDVRPSVSGRMEGVRLGQSVRDTFANSWINNEDTASPSTPSQHRTCLPVPSPRATRSPFTQPYHGKRVNNNDANAQRNHVTRSHTQAHVNTRGYGISSGVRMGRLQDNSSI